MLTIPISFSEIMHSLVQQESQADAARLCIYQSRTKTPLQRSEHTPRRGAHARSIIIHYCM